MFRVRYRWCWLLAAGIGVLPLLSRAAEQKPRSLYEGAAAVFEQAQLIKPREDTNHNRAFTLAPVILQEVRGKAAPAAPAKVYFQPGSTRLHDLPHEQMTYWWFYDEPKPADRRLPVRRGPDVRPLKPKPAGPGGSTPLLGLRLTMSTNGVPVIYELLGGSHSIRQIFVTQSIEAGAMAESGPPLPGRRHSVECNLNEAPEVVVPRVLDDPPDIMGPILYLEAETHALATLICRCMDAQARELVGQALYELVPAGYSGNTPGATRLDAANPRGLPEDFTIPSNDLSRSLRLPRGF